MPGPAPNVQTRQIALNLMNKPGFAQLPPDVQAVVNDAAQGMSISGQRWQTVLDSARSSNLIGPDSPWWAGLAEMGMAIAGGTALSSAFGSAGAAGAGGAGASGAGGAGAAGTGGAGAAGGGAFSRFLKGIGGGRTLADLALSGAGLYLQNKQANNAQDANTKAQQAQQDAANRAIDLQDRMYQTTRNDLAPYRALGQGAAAGLGYFVGIPGFEQGNRGILPQSAMPAPMTTSTTPTGGTAVPRNPSAVAAQNPVTLMAPDGSRRTVPADQADHYINLGAKVVA